ncbi:peptidoglycan recognition family protein [Blastococcus sp. LR1]|uniref:peptidoglycan recognition protein family protein n=1 Tax=Blastococcus sp. LR1 TaxID=2877000 RepID=UPI001CCC164E|nr:peptidoglycan recognition family protein [Blastococcus sp. LR1]MCA0144895.1 peptidoglycan recognition protein family protein [Blastococcus sp. LR1]
MLSRRTVLQGLVAAGLAVPLATSLPRPATAAPALAGLEIRPRAAWAEGLGAPAPLPVEAPGDVRFLLVHHSASPNGYAAGDVPGTLRGFHGFHTGADKGWPDVAYNFFVDRYGVVWEGRSGSLDGPVQPSATGGSQGFAQICCFVGDHTTEPPTPEAQRSMVALLAGLAERYGIDPTPGVTTTFVSRGSNRWPAGASVTTPTIAGHRDMSVTSCPGDAAYPLVRDAFPGQVAALLAARTPPAPAPPEPGPTAAPAPAPEQSAAPSDPATAAGPQDDDRSVDGTSPLVLAAGGAAAVATAAAVYRFSRVRTPEQPAAAQQSPQPPSEPLAGG